jgi:serine/threonine protein kinase/formylglycine-generating enzyme required for sulfatase activity
MILRSCPTLSAAIADPESCRMSHDPTSSEDSLPVADLREVDRICRQFEAAWRSGRQPKVEDYLGEISEPRRSHLQRELLSIERELAAAPRAAVGRDALPAIQVDVGHVLGNYLLLDKLGQGGMGQVYKARHLRMDRVVAIKMVLAKAARSADAIARFQREVRAAARLSHPNVVTAFDADEASGIPFLVMEYVDGPDLASLVAEQGPLAVARTVDYVSQAARGLDYAHSQGVIHRDVKPRNLLVDREGRVKILDLGLAHVAGLAGAAADGLTRTGQVLGTLDYVSPEQAFDARNVDARTDIYSLGCTLYFLLFGKAPYEADTPAKKMLAHRQHAIPYLRPVRPDVPEALDSLFQRMMAKEPAGRPRSLSEVITALEGIADAGLRQAPDLPAAVSTRSETIGFDDPHIATSSEYLERLSAGSDEVVPRSAGSEDVVPRSAARPGAPTVRAEEINRRTTRRKISVAAVLGAAVLAVLWGIVVTFQTRDGLLTLQIEESNVTVKILSEQGKVEIERPAGKGTITISVEPGKHQLRLERDGEQLFSKEFSLVSGGKETIVAKIERPAAPEAPPKAGGAAAPPLAVAPFDEEQAKQHQQAWAKHLGAPLGITNSIGITLALIPPGEFLMGSPPNVPASADEMPAHLVRITRPLWMGVHEVTVEQFRRFVQASGYQVDAQKVPNNVFGFDPESGRAIQDPRYNWEQPGIPQTGRHPVCCISWNDADAFCRWLSQEEKTNYRLPTEAEWEYACRAGTQSLFFHDNDLDTLHLVANVRDATLKERYPAWGGTIAGRDGFDFTAPVGSFSPNSFGLFDMVGNVAEYCQDYYAGDYFAVSPQDNPPGPETGSRRVGRGDGWHAITRIANRFILLPDRSEYTAGFRVVRPLD